MTDEHGMVNSTHLGSSRNCETTCAPSTVRRMINRALRELANPNLHDANLVTAFKIELWDRYGRDHLRMVIAATSSSAIAHAAFDAAVVQYGGERLTLRKGAMVLREH